MMLPKQITNITMLVVAFCALSTFCRADDLQPTVHALVESYINSDTKGAKWEADKKTLAGYSPEQLVRALIAEIDIDRGNPTRNKDRDVSGYVLFRALDLPPALICQELDKPSSPERKASLMFVLRHTNKSEVVQALLRQLGDHRPVNGPEMMSLEAGMKTHPFRVCDNAYNTLVDTITVPNLRRASPYNSDKGRDNIIHEGLTLLKLTLP